MDLICFSHLRWNFVYQRPQHLMGRAAKSFRTYFFEEPLLTSDDDHYLVTQTSEGVSVVVPYLKDDHADSIERRLQILLERLMIKETITEYIFWYYTPMMLPLGKALHPELVVYDCMDQLSAFDHANPLMEENESQLLKEADIVFTGGPSLYEAKKHMHKNIFCKPSSIEFEHFSQARKLLEDPSDQKEITHPRLGFYGVIDERFDIDLLSKAATLKPDYNFVIIGPVVKINPESLPKNKNIHYLGIKSYDELPNYIGNWDVALLLFALNRSTQFISPTKTPEYLAAGLPVISTAINDVELMYGDLGLVDIIDTPEQLIKAAEDILKIEDHTKRLSYTDGILATNSWDNTWKEMLTEMETILSTKKQRHIDYV